MVLFERYMTIRNLLIEYIRNPNVQYVDVVIDTRQYYYDDLDMFANKIVQVILIDYNGQYYQSFSPNIQVLITDLYINYNNQTIQKYRIPNTVEYFVHENQDDIQQLNAKTDER